MANLILNEKTYDLSKLPQEARNQVTSLQFVETELQRLQAHAAVLQTAKNAYINALKPHLAALEAQQVRPH